MSGFGFSFVIGSIFTSGSCDGVGSIATFGSRGGGGNLNQAKSASSAIGTAEVNLVKKPEYAKGDRETSYFPVGLSGCLKYVRMGILPRIFLC